MSRIFLLVAFAVSVTNFGFADAVVLFDELADPPSDLSNFHSAPTDLGSLADGASEVTGQLFNIFDKDPDIFTFTVDSGQVLDSISLTIDGDQHFMALSQGTTISSTNTSTMLLARLIGSSDSSANLLTDVPGTLYTSSVPGAPLAAGDYTIWLQETAVEDALGYTFTFQTSAVTAVPEPSSLFLLGTMGAMCCLRRNRRAWCFIQT